jgi:hypothetical protein
VVSTCSYGAAGGVDVEVDWFLRVVGFEEEELGDDGGGHGLVDFAIEADDALLWCLLVRVYGAGIAFRTFRSREKISSVSGRRSSLLVEGSG